MTNLHSILKSRDITNKGPSSQSSGFSSSHVWMWELDYKGSWAQKNWCFWTVVLEKILESPLDCKKIQPVHPKGNQPWIFIGRTDAEAETPTWCKELTHWKRPWCWERLEVGEGDNRGWDGWMASPTQWTWVWVSSRSWWWTGKPGVLQSIRSQRVRHDWATELNWVSLPLSVTCWEQLMGSVNQPRCSGVHQRAAARALVNCVPRSCMSSECILMFAQSFGEHSPRAQLPSTLSTESSFHISHPHTLLSLVF